MLTERFSICMAPNHAFGWHHGRDRTKITDAIIRAPASIRTIATTNLEAKAWKFWAVYWPRLCVGLTTGDKLFESGAALATFCCLLPAELYHKRKERNPGFLGPSLLQHSGRWVSNTTTGMSPVSQLLPCQHNWSQ
jgi:hypothetical protein